MPRVVDGVQRGGDVVSQRGRRTLAALRQTQRLLQLGHFVLSLRLEVEQPALVSLNGRGQIVALLGERRQLILVIPKRRGR